MGEREAATARERQREGEIAHAWERVSDMDRENMAGGETEKDKCVRERVGECESVCVRERETHTQIHTYVYIYVFTERERKRERGRE